MTRRGTVQVASTNASAHYRREGLGVERYKRCSRSSKCFVDPLGSIGLLQRRSS